MRCNQGGHLHSLRMVHDHALHEIHIRWRPGRQRGPRRRRQRAARLTRRTRLNPDTVNWRSHTRQHTKCHLLQHRPRVRAIAILNGSVVMLPMTSPSACMGQLLYESRAATGALVSLTIYLLLSQRKYAILPVGNQNGGTTFNTKMKQKTDVLQGTLALMVLKTLDVLGPQHGYGIARRIEQISGDLLAVNQGTLYPVLLKLEQEGAIVKLTKAPVAALDS